VLSIVIDGGDYTISTMGEYPAIGSMDQGISWNETISILGGNFSLSAAGGIAAPRGVVEIANGTVNIDYLDNEMCVQAQVLRITNASINAVTSSAQLFTFEWCFITNSDLLIGYRNASGTEILPTSCLHFGTIDPANMTEYNLTFGWNLSFARKVRYNATELMGLLVSLPANHTYSVEASDGRHDLVLCEPEYFSSDFPVGATESYYSNVGMCEKTNRTKIATVTPPATRTATIARTTIQKTATEMQTASRSRSRTVSISGSPIPSPPPSPTRTITISVSQPQSATGTPTPVETRTPAVTATFPRPDTPLIVGVAAGGGLVVLVVLAIITKIVFLPRCRRESGRLVIIPPDEVWTGPSITGQFIDPD
jgi:hypothetical protein